MVKINAAGYDDPTGVASGGSGVASATAYSVLCGGTTTTGALQSVSGVGTSGQILTSAGAAALPTWTTVSAGNADWTAITSSSASGASVSFTSGLGTAYDEYLIIFEALSQDSENKDMNLAVSVDAGSNYDVVLFYGGGSQDMGDAGGVTPWPFIETTDSSRIAYGFIIFGGNKTATAKYYEAGYASTSGSDQGDGCGVINTTSDIDALQFACSGTAEFDGGTIYILGR